MVRIGNPAFTMEEIKRFWKKLVKIKIRSYEFLFLPVFTMVGIGNGTLWEVLGEISMVRFTSKFLVRLVIPGKSARPLANAPLNGKLWKP